MFKQADEIQVGEWITPIGEEWPCEIIRVTRCNPGYDIEQDRMRMTYMRFWFGNGQDIERTTEHPDCNLVWVFD